jgi:hypothetical protein
MAEDEVALAAEVRPLPALGEKVARPWPKLDQPSGGAALRLQVRLAVGGILGWIFVGTIVYSIIGAP